jgi:hypothetical protein
MTKTITRRCVSRQGASTRARDCRASALRHTRAPAKLPPIYLINNEYLNATVRLQSSKPYHIKLIASEKLATGTYRITAKFNQQSWGWASDSGGIRASLLFFFWRSPTKANDKAYPPTAARCHLNQPR